MSTDWLCGVNWIDVWPSIVFPDKEMVTIPVLMFLILHHPFTASSVTVVAEAEFIRTMKSAEVRVYEAVLVTTGPMLVFFQVPSPAKNVVAEAFVPEFIWVTAMLPNKSVNDSCAADKVPVVASPEKNG